MQNFRKIHPANSSRPRVDGHTDTHTHFLTYGALLMQRTVNLLDARDLCISFQKKRTRTKSEAIRTIVSKKDMENLKSLSWEKLLRTLKRCDFFRNFDFSEFSVQLNANISKTRMFLDLQFFEVIKKNYNYDIKRFHKQFIRSFWKNLLQKWKNTNFCLFFAPFFTF